MILDTATILASYLEPNQLHILANFPKVKYDASNHALNVIPSSFIITGITISPKDNFFPNYPHNLRSVHLGHNIINTTLQQAIIDFFQQAINVTSLTISCFDSSYIKILPYLSKLKTLKFKSCCNVHISALCPTLQHLHIQSCGRIHDVSHLTNLHNLKKFVIINTNFPLPQFKCKHLTHLIMDNIGIYELETLQCPHLKKLTLGNIRMKTLSFLSSCPNIRNLCIRRGPTHTIPNLHKCKKLTIDSCELNDLKFLTDLPILTHATLVDCEITKIDDLEQCSKLRNMVFTRCRIKNKPELQIKHSMIISVNDAKRPRNYEWFEKDNLNLSREIHLGKFDDIEGIATRTTFLQDSTVIALCDSLAQNLDAFKICKNLNLLQIYDCTRLRNIKGLIDCPSLGVLLLSNCKALDLSPLKECSNLKSISINDSKLPDLSVLPLCSALNELTILRCNFREFSVIPVCATVRLIAIGLCPNLIDLSCLSKWEKVMRLEISKCDSIVELPVCENIKDVQIYDCSALKDISAMHKYSKMIRLDVRRCDNLDKDELMKLMKCVEDRKRK